MPYLLYDGDCSLCAYLAAWVHIQDRRQQRLAMLALQLPQARVLVPRLSDDEYRQSFHLVMEERVVSGDAAIPRVLEYLPGVWRMLGWSMRVLPGGSWLTGLFYRWLATQRGRRRR